MRNKTWFIIFTLALFPIFFCLLVLTLSLIVKPKTINSSTQIYNIFQNNLLEASYEILEIKQEFKNEIENKIITIFFINKNEKKHILANQWILDNFLIIRNVSTNVEDFKPQKTCLLFSYESLLTFTYYYIFK